MRKILHMELVHYNLFQLIDFIEEPNRECCLQLFKSNEDMFLKAPGSKTKHQAWPGGYIDHIEEGMNFGVWLHDLMAGYRPLPFSKGDALLAFFLHDIEKPFKYCGNVAGLDTDEAKYSFLLNGIVAPYKFCLTEAHLNAIRFAHGEGGEYDPFTRVQLPLGAFIQMCDVASARIWHDYPKNH